MINHGIAPEDLKIIHNILHHYKKNVYIFGSRIKNTYKPFSDLDICIKLHLSDYEVELLNEKFIKSDLPFKVDITLYDEADTSFKKLIDSEAIPLSQLQ